MAKKRTIKFLVISQSDNEGERLVSLFRNAGRVARAQRVLSAEELVGFCRDDEWDLLIANDHYADLSPEQAVEQLKKQHFDIPVIIVRQSLSDSQIDPKIDAADIVGSGDDQRLVFAAIRELDYLGHRRELAELREKLGEAEHRSELLMSQAQDAVAYVADGMLISVNAAFAERFGYSEPDDLDCLPIIDVIAGDDHERFKGVLKSQTAAGEGSSEITISGISASDDTFIANVEITCATVDGEACLQLTVRDQGQSGSAGNGAGASLRMETLTQIGNLLKQTTGGATSGALAFVSIDNFNQLRDQHGLQLADQVLHSLEEFLKPQIKPTDFSACYCDDAIVLLMSSMSNADAEKLAEKLHQSVEKHITEIGEQSVQCTVSIGLLELNGQTAHEPEQLIDSAYRAVVDLRGEKGGNGVNWYVPARQRRSLSEAGNDAELDHIIEEAIDDGRFILRFQPVVSLRGAEGDHYEVSVSLLSEDGESEQTVDEFIHQLNFTGVNTRLDRWIILEATKKLAEQRDQGQDTRLFINLTGNALLDDSLIPWLNVALKAGGLPAASISFQFLEKDLTDSLKPALAFTEQLRGAGCSLSIADVGTASDPIKIVKQIRANFAKISSEHTDALISGGDTQPLKQLIADLREESCRCIIPDVGNAATLAQLWQMGVDFIQGDYLAPASPGMTYEFADIA